MSPNPVLAPNSRRFVEILGTDFARPESVPFSAGDVTTGSETELQAAVAGSASSVDLPLSIRSSNYFRNVVYRAAVGDTSRRSISRLERYLEENQDGIWENSWVRFPMCQLGVYAGFVLDHDLCESKPPLHRTSARVQNSEYRLALMRILRRDADDLIEVLGFQYVVADLEGRLHPAGEAGAADRLTEGILAHAGLKSVFSRNARSLESRGRSVLSHDTAETVSRRALDFLEGDLGNIQASSWIRDQSIREAIQYALAGRSSTEHLRMLKERILQETLTLDEVRSVICLLLISEHRDAKEEATFR